MPGWDEKTPAGKDPNAPPVGMNPQTLQLLATLFGKPSAAPGVTGGGDPSIQMPSRVVTGPPQVQAPPPSSAGAAAPMPQAPQGAAPQQAVPSMGGPMEFSTGAGRSGAITSSAIGSVFGAIHQMTDKKNQDEIQHAKFLYDMVTTAQAAGDQQTVQAVLGNPKLAKKIEKYLTGELPRVPGGPAQSQGKGAPQQKQPAVNSPGGIALPQANQQSQNAAMVQNIIGERLKRNDPATIDAMLGPGANMKPEEFAQATRAKFGLELSPAQVQAMSSEAQIALQKYQADVLKVMISKQADQDRLESITKMNISGRRGDTELEVKGRQNVAAMNIKSRETIAAMHRDLMKTLKKTDADKMDETIFKGQAKQYTTMAKDFNDQATALEKLGKTDIAKEYRVQAGIQMKKGEELGKMYEWTKQSKEILGNIPLPNPEGDDQE